jgi:murein DD-endopeptidase MepM/ murein hydrolase activator NlpD
MMRALIGAAMLLLAGAAPLSQSAAAAEQALRESFDLRVVSPPGAVSTEGRSRVFYELQLTNFAKQALTPARVQVVDADSGASVAVFDGAALARQLAPAVPAAQPGSGPAVAPGQRSVLYVELDLAPGAMPRALSHRVDYVVDGEAASHSVEGGPATLDADAVATLSAPLRGGPWAAVFDPAWARGHRRVFYAVDGRATIPGRFAIDWVKLDDDGRMARGDADLVANAHAYGEDVLAVADATVLAVRNDYPETARLSENGRHGLAGASGNHVVLDLGQGRHAFYEHLRPGSMRVEVGQRVRRGQAIAEVGYSGSGNWPHLHFHLGDAPSLLGAEGLPFAIDGFRALGAYEDFADLGKRPWTPRGGDGAQRQRERPVDNGVVMFPD